MPLCQLTSRSEALIDAQLPAANDNYQPINPSKELFEEGSVLAPSDYTTRRNLAHIVMVGFGAILFAVAFILPLLK